MLSLCSPKNQSMLNVTEVLNGLQNYPRGSGIGYRVGSLKGPFLSVKAMIETSIQTGICRGTKLEKF